MGNPADGVLKIVPSNQGDARVLAVAGQLTEQECSPFLKALHSELQTRSGTVVLDLTEMLYMSSAGLGALVSIHNKFKEAGRKLILAGANSRVRKLLALTNLDMMIENTDTVEEALGK